MLGKYTSINLKSKLYANIKALRAIKDNSLNKRQ